MVKKRHQAETVALLKSKYAEVQDKLGQHVALAFERLEARRAEIEAMKQGGEITEHQALVMVEELDQEIDQDHIKEQLKKELGPKHDELLRKLRETHNREVKDLFGKFFPDEDFSSAQWTLEAIDMKTLIAENEKKREEEERQLQEQMKELEQREQQRKQELELEKKRRMNEFEEKMELERADMEGRFEEEMKRKQDEAEAHKAQLQASLARAGLTEGENRVMEEQIRQIEEHAKVEGKDKRR